MLLIASSVACMQARGTGQAPIHRAGIPGWAARAARDVTPAPRMAAHRAWCTLTRSTGEHGMSAAPGEEGFKFHRKPKKRKEMTPRGWPVQPGSCPTPVTVILKGYASQTRTARDTSCLE